MTMLAVVMLTQSFLMQENAECLNDTLFEVTAPLNVYFTDHTFQRHMFMITCGLMMDIMVITLLIRFCFYGTSWRLVLALLVFYGFRAIVQNLF